MIIIISAIIIGAIVLILFGLSPNIQGIGGALKGWQEKKETKLSMEYEALFDTKGTTRKKLKLYYALPVILGIVGAVVYKSVLFLVFGVVIGMFIPKFMLKAKASQRRVKFDGQILNAIMVLSSSLKGGLSLLQSLEVVAEEMPAPMSEEIGLVVRENKMGVPLEDALKHLNDRMKLPELTLLLNSILVAKGTGGDLTKVFSRLTVTIRDNRKLRDNIRTLTLQGKMQGIIMSGLPFVFVWWVMMSNKGHFDIMLKSEIGRMLIFAAIFLQAVGMFLIQKFSKINI